MMPAAERAAGEGDELRIIAGPGLAHLHHRLVDRAVARRRQRRLAFIGFGHFGEPPHLPHLAQRGGGGVDHSGEPDHAHPGKRDDAEQVMIVDLAQPLAPADPKRSEEHTSELQSLMRTSYAVFCLKKTRQQIIKITISIQRTKYRTKTHTYNKV